MTSSPGRTTEPLPGKVLTTFGRSARSPILSGARHFILAVTVSSATVFDAVTMSSETVASFAAGLAGAAAMAGRDDPRLSKARNDHRKAARRFPSDVMNGIRAAPFEHYPHERRRQKREAPRG